MRLEELIRQQAPLTPQKAASILRDDKGLGGEPIGLTNEKSIHQYIAHHSVIFMPEQRLMWVSTSPWQSGRYLCYNLDRIFGETDSVSFSHAESGRDIAEDSCFLENGYAQVLRYRERAAAVRKALTQSVRLSDAYVDSLTIENPDFYEAYLLQGDYRFMVGNRPQAETAWKTALTKEIPSENQREEIEKKIRKYGKR